MRSRVIAALVSALGSAGVVLALAAPAAAATGPRYFSPEQAGYVATRSRFQYVQSTVRLPNAANFASEVVGFGLSAQLWTKYGVVVLGVSNSTTGGNYNAAVAVFNRSTHALICSTAARGAQQCPNVGSRWTDGSVSFAPGDDVTLAISYDRSTGRDHFFVDDETTGVELFYSGYVPGTGKIYTQARVGAEFAADPWGSFNCTAPAAETHLATFRDSVLVTYGGGVSSFSSWWTHHKILATSDGSASGTVEVMPHNLYNFGGNFGVYLEP
ncbi:MAG TPA: hypothetical protein VGJ54_09265 [Streptosporangiaceae bacterium]